jgi:hypothetical protein
MADLRDFFQGASNSVASNVSAPVDGIAWLLRKAGLPIPTNPVGGSDWMAQRGLTAEPQNKIAGLLGESIGGVAPMLAAAKAPQIAKGLLQAGDNLAAPRTLNPQTGAIVWHGSPHKFDKFDSSKIGTGEGAQAYGHGLYLAESPEVATSYKDVLAQQKPLQGGAVVDSSKLGLSPQAKKVFDYNLSNNDPVRIQRFAQQGVPEYVEAWNALKYLEPNPGSLYKVDLPDEHIAKMLDWDKPLSQQHPDVQAAFSLDKFPNNSAANLTGMEAYIKTGQQLGEPTSSSVSAAQHLLKKGIPGIRYLDGGSRGTGAGTSNFVVFPGNEGLLQILERNGQPLNKLSGLLDK